jgi:hypothetical protein
VTYKSIPPRSDLLWLGVDLDGTLARPIWTPDNPTSEIGEPLPKNVARLRRAVDKGYKNILHTSRPWTDYENIEGWLHYYGIPFKEIQCGKPLYYRYIDDRAITAIEEADGDWV